MTTKAVEVIIRTTPSDGSLDKRIQLFITTDCKLQVTRSDPLYFEVLGSVTRQLQHLQSTRESPSEGEAFEISVVSVDLRL